MPQGNSELIFTIQNGARMTAFVSWDHTYRTKQPPLVETAEHH